MRTLFRLLVLGAAVVVLFTLLAPSLVKGAGNALLTSINGSTQILPALQGKSITLQIHLDSLSPNTHYEVSLDRDQCGGLTLLDVGQITTDQNGTASVDFSLASLGDALQHSVWMNIHQGPDVSGQSVACGPVQVNDAILATLSTPASSNNVTQDPGALNSRPPHVLNQMPHTGVAPAQKDWYDNYTFPRKY